MSVMVLALTAWVLLSRHLGRCQSPFGWILATVAVISGALWLRAQQTVLRLHRSLARPIQWTHLLHS